MESARRDARRVRPVVEPPGSVGRGYAGVRKKQTRPRRDAPPRPSPYARAPAPSLPNGKKNGPTNAKALKELYRQYELPPALKRQMVDDWEFVTKERRWVTLPRDPCVADLLMAWAQTQRAKKNGARNGPVDRNAREVAEALIDYFDAALGTMLLYRSERLQYNNFMAKRKGKPSKVYGAEHLCRLFVELPRVMQQARVDEKTVRLLGEKLVDIYKFLEYNGRIAFLVEYQAAR